LEQIFLKIPKSYGRVIIRTILAQFLLEGEGIIVAYTTREACLTVMVAHFTPDNELCEREVLTVEMRQRTQAVRGG